MLNRRASAKKVRPKSMIKTWEEKQVERKRIEALKEKDRELKRKKAEEKEKLRERTKANKRRREENEIKSTVYQVVS